MPGAHEIVIDPFLLCLPNPCSSADQLELFIDSLLGWSGMIGQMDTCVLLSDSARIALHDDDEYPHRHRLSELLTRYKCNIADENTVSQLANGILQRTPSFEDYYGIDAVLFDDKGVKIEPTLILSRLKGNCQTAFVEILTTISLVRHLRTDESRDTILVASALRAEDLEPVPDEINFESVIHEIGFTQPEMRFSEDLPYKAVDKIPISFSHDELLNRLGLWAVWDHGSSEESALSAIDIRINQLVESGVDPKERFDFKLGSHFLESAKKWGAGSRSDIAMVIIESCARIVLSVPKNSIKQFRINAKSTSGQRTRKDGAKAYRTHLTKKGAGLRLMMWMLPNGAFEFANVGDKDELEIL